MRRIVPRARCGLAAALLGALTGCFRPFALPFSRDLPPPPPDYVTRPASEVPKLSETEFLMRKARAGARPERLEALIVLDRSPDPAKLPFLIERLEKEDDPFLRMQIIRSLARTRDLRAVQALRRLARWDTTRAGIEAIEALYRLGDDHYVSRLIQVMRQPEEYGQTAKAAHRALQRLYGYDLSASPRLWDAYFKAHRLPEIAGRERWYNPFFAPPPAVKPSSTEVAAVPEVPPPPPKGDARLRRLTVSFHEFWKQDEP